MTNDEWDELAQPLPTPKRQPAPANNDDHLNSLIAPIKSVLDAGDRVTLLKRVGEDCKLPLMPGFNDPTENVWNLGNFREHIEWARSKRIEITGYGIIMGSMSRNRFVLDFDAGDMLHEIAAKVLEVTSHDILQWPRVRSGRSTTPGYHLHARAGVPIKSEPLARCKDENGHARVICEIVGDGKQLVGPGSLHKSGRLYVVEHGDINNPPVIDIGTIRQIIEVVRTFDTLPVVVKTRPVSTTPRVPRSYAAGTSGREIADRYNAETSITSALEMHGYVAGGNGTHYVHPNNDSGQSVSILDDTLAYHFGANDPFGAGETSTPFALYAHFDHGGRWGDAVKSLALQYGIAHQPETYEPVDCVWESNLLEWLDAEAVKVIEQMVVDRQPVGNNGLAFDLGRLPERMRRGIAGLAKANPLLPLSSQILVPFAYAGAMIGKRKRFENMNNLYYPNLWTVCAAPSNSNKTGTRNLIMKGVPLDIQLPDTATMEALIDRMGRTVKGKDVGRADIDAARNAAIIENEQDHRGGVMIADEVTGTIKRLLGGDARQPDRNIETLLRLATSGERYDQPTMGTGQRFAYDLCVSLIGWTQAETWQTMFADERYRSNGFVGRVITCCQGLEFTGLPDVPDDEWQTFAALMRPDDGEWSNARKRDADFGVTKGRDPIKEAMHRVMATRSWQVLVDTVGDYAKQLYGKIIGHAIKLAMICEWFDGKAIQWFEACAELVTSCYANYFHTTYGSDVTLNQQHHTALVYIRENPGTTVDKVRRKLNLRDRAEAWQVLNALQEADRIDVLENPKRKNSHVIFERK